MSESFGDISFATKLRDIVIEFARREVQRFHPPASYGQVVSFDRRGLTASVLFPGATEPVNVRMGAVQPQVEGQKVRVCPKNGDLFLEDVIGPAYFVGIAGRAVSGGSSQPVHDEQMVATPVPNSSSLLYGEGQPAVEVGTMGDFYIDIVNWKIYGPKGVTWPEPASLTPPASPTGPPDFSE